MYSAVVITSILLVCVAAQRELDPTLEDQFIGGENTTTENFPYQVSLLYAGFHICGGAIVSDTIVISAAQCVVLKLPSLLKISAGTKYSNITGDGVVVAVKKIHIHEKYNPILTDFDISILVLAQSLPFNDKIYPIALPEVDEEFQEGTRVYVSGFESAQLYIIGHRDCSNAYKYYKITENMICAGDLNGGSGACQLDRGDPLIVNQNYTTTLVGIVSWGNSCTRSGPGVYAEVTAMRNWIQEKTDL